MSDDLLPPSDDTLRPHLPPNASDLVAGNRSFADGINLGGLSAVPRKRLCVLSCMDTRVTVHAMLGLGPGDAHVIRNAGGRMNASVLVDMIISAHRLGVKEIVVIHHTKCGAENVDFTALKEEIAQTTGSSVDDLDLGISATGEAGVRETVRMIRECQQLPSDIIVWGAMFDVDTGLLHPIDIDLPNISELGATLHHRNERLGQRLLEMQAEQQLGVGL